MTLSRSERGVRIPSSLPSFNMGRSSSGIGFIPFKDKSGVRVSVALPSSKCWCLLIGIGTLPFKECNAGSSPVISTNLIWLYLLRVGNKFLKLVIASSILRRVTKYGMITIWTATLSTPHDLLLRQQVIFI